MNSGSRGEVRMQALDRDEALEAADAGEAREVHRRHAAGGELGDQLEPIEPSALALDGYQLAQGTASRQRVMAPL